MNYEFNQHLWLLYDDDISRYLFDRMDGYSRDANRKDPSSAFTAGATRTVARLIQQAVLAERSRCAAIADLRGVAWVGEEIRRGT